MALETVGGGGGDRAPLVRKTQADDKKRTDITVEFGMSDSGKLHTNSINDDDFNRFDKEIVI